jgi:3-oxoacyl-(acyl-carrier-protein) synthase
MSAALKRAGLTASDIDYINAHGTSTMADTIELGAVERLLGDHAPAMRRCRSTKSSIGHLLGAAGAVEAIFCVLAIRDQVAPPTINLDNPAVQPRSWTWRRTIRCGARSTWRCRTPSALAVPTPAWSWGGFAEACGRASPRTR